MAIRRQFYQIGWVVDDLDKRMQQWLATGTTGPFLCMRSANDGVSTPLYRGNPFTTNMHIGLTQVGGIQLELIQPVGDEPSPYRELVPTGHTAVHHMAWMTEDLDGEYEQYRKAGVPPVFEGSKGDFRFAYFDTSAELGCMTELVQIEPSAEALNQMVVDAAANWDGSEPIRDLSF